MHSLSIDNKKMNEKKILSLSLPFNFSCLMILQINFDGKFSLTFFFSYHTDSLFHTFNCFDFLFYRWKSTNGKTIRAFQHLHSIFVAKILVDWYCVFLLPIWFFRVFFLYFSSNTVCDNWADLFYSWKSEKKKLEIILIN